MTEAILRQPMNVQPMAWELMFDIIPISKYSLYTWQG